MSTYKAIAAVSETLKALLEDRMERSDSDEIPAVTLAPLDIKPTSGDYSRGRVNLYLYRVTENPYLKNQEIPGRGQRGAYGCPPLSLDLHYLLTTHGDPDETTEESDRKAQLFLGNAMRVFHDYSTVSPSLTRMNPQGGNGAILRPDLSSEFEQIKITFHPISLEDLSKIWSAFPEANYRRSVAYQVSVVQIESKLDRTYPKPVTEPDVGGPSIAVVGLNLPRITDVYVIRQADPKKVAHRAPHTRIGDTVVIIGKNLQGTGTRIYLDTVDVPLQNAVLGDDRIEFAVPDLATLQPGSVTLQLRREVPLGKSAEAHEVLESNTATLLLVPHITAASVAAGDVTITGVRLYRSEDECLVLFDEHVVGSANYSTKREDEIVVPPPAELSGDVSVRVRVNGAESIDSKKVTLA